MTVLFLAEGANGDGMAIVSSLRSFDREQQKEFHVPIVIKDSGNPAMSGTSTLTVIIGDVNDNKMQAGAKDIFVYNYMVSYFFGVGGYFYNMFWMNCLKLIIFISQTGSGTGYRSGTSVRLRSGRLGFAGQEILLGHERASEFLSPSGHWHVDNAPWNAWRQIPSSFPRLRSQTYSSRCASQCDHHRSRDYPRSCDQFRFHPHSWHFRRRFHPHLGL